MKNYELVNEDGEVLWEVKAKNLASATTMVFHKAMRDKCLKRLKETGVYLRDVREYKKQMFHHLVLKGVRGFKCGLSHK